MTPNLYFQIKMPRWPFSRFWWIHSLNFRIALVKAKSTILGQHPESDTFGVVLPWNTLNNTVFLKKGTFLSNVTRGSVRLPKADFFWIIPRWFCQFQAIASPSFAFFLDKNSSIFNVVTHNSWVYHQLNTFKILRMVHYNQKISDNLDQQCKVHSPFSHLFNFLELLIIASTDHS